MVSQQTPVEAMPCFLWMTLRCVNHGRENENREDSKKKPASVEFKEGKQASDSADRGVEQKAEGGFKWNPRGI